MQLSFRTRRGPVPSKPRPRCSPWEAEAPWSSRWRQLGSWASGRLQTPGPERVGPAQDRAEAELDQEVTLEMPYVKDPRVDAYLDGLPAWQHEICSRVRDLVHSADPEVEETIKRTVQPYFVLAGHICALLAARDHVNVFLYDGAIVPDPEGIITAGQDNQTARTVAFRRNEPINERAL